MLSIQRELKRRSNEKISTSFFEILLSVAMNIIIDHREKSSGIIDLLKEENIQIQVKKLFHGDYIINHFVTVERKTALDFLKSIIDGRLFNQISNLKNNCANPTLLIEGNPYKTDLDFNPDAIRGALISISTIWHIPIIFSRSIHDTRDVLKMIGKQDEDTMNFIQLRSGYRPKKLKSKQLYLLQGLPKVGPTMAKRLLTHFKTVSAIMNASTKELMQVEGIGRSSAEKIREVLEQEPFYTLKINTIYGKG